MFALAHYLSSNAVAHLQLKRPETECSERPAAICFTASIGSHTTLSPCSSGHSGHLPVFDFRPFSNLLGWMQALQTRRERGAFAWSGREAICTVTCGFL